MVTAVRINARAKPVVGVTANNFLLKPERRSRRGDGQPQRQAEISDAG
jgi:hypothetical protein